MPSVLWYCWLGLLTCKNRRPYNLYCVGGDVKHCSLTLLWPQEDAYSVSVLMYATPVLNLNVQQTTELNVCWNMVMCKIFATTKCESIWTVIVWCGSVHVMLMILLCKIDFAGDFPRRILDCVNYFVLCDNLCDNFMLSVLPLSTVDMSTFLLLAEFSRFLDLFPPSHAAFMKSRFWRIFKNSGIFLIIKLSSRLKLVVGCGSTLDHAGKAYDAPPEPLVNRAGRHSSPFPSPHGTSFWKVGMSVWRMHLNVQWLKCNRTRGNSFPTSNFWS